MNFCINEDDKANGWKNTISSAFWHKVSQIITEQLNPTGVDQGPANYSSWPPVL